MQTNSWVAKPFTARIYFYIVLGTICGFSLLNYFYLSNLEAYGTLQKLCMAGTGGGLAFPDWFQLYSIATQSLISGDCYQYTLRTFDSSGALYIHVAGNIAMQSLATVAIILLFHRIATRFSTAT